MGIEETKRLTPTPTVARNLYGASGNRCAYPGCDSPLVRSDGVVVGEIAHIEAAMPDGPRFNKHMSNQERRAPANLMIMCATCHTITDADTDTWTVEKLQALKADHEALYTGAVDVLRRQVGDVTEGVTWTPSENLAKILNLSDFNDEEQQGNLQAVNELGERLAGVPYGARTVLALIINRGNEVGYNSHWNSEFSIPVTVLKQVASCTEDELFEHLDVLKHQGFGWFEDVEYEGQEWEYQVGRSSGEDGWKLFVEIKNAAAGDPKIVREAIVDLDFTVFDT